MSIRSDLCDWLRANGLDPGRIPETAGIRVHDGQITTRVMALNLKGHRMVNAAGDGLVMHEITVPVPTAPAGAVAEWLSNPHPLDW